MSVPRNKTAKKPADIFRASIEGIEDALIEPKKTLEKAEAEAWQAKLAFKKAQAGVDAKRDAAFSQYQEVYAPIFKSLLSKEHLGTLVSDAIEQQRTAEETTAFFNVDKNGQQQLVIRLNPKEQLGEMARIAEMRQDFLMSGLISPALREVLIQGKISHESGSYFVSHRDFKFDEDGLRIELDNLPKLSEWLDVEIPDINSFDHDQQTMTS